MVFLLTCLTATLLILVIILTLKMKRKNKEIDYVVGILSKVTSENPKNRIRLNTSDIHIKNLCFQINVFLNNFKQLEANEADSKEAMKKMLSNISHDLRTPLTVMLGYIDQLNSDICLNDEDKVKYLNKLEVKTHEVIALMNDFFSLSKLESGDESIILGKINISEILRETILSYYSSLESQGFEMDIQIPEDDIFCLGDEKSIKRVLDNLITNSIKYGYDGNLIGLKLYEEKELVWIEQWDKGRGIADTEKKKVFERLYTLDDSRNKNYQGSGLGLTIVQTLIHKMQGEIILESVPFKKTTFKFYLRKQV